MCPLEGILAACVAEIFRGTDSRAGSLGLSTLTDVLHDSHNGCQVCETLMVHMAFWSGPLGPFRGAVTGSGGNFNLSLPRGDTRDQPM